jgi:hypothetical protein
MAVALLLPEMTFEEAPSRVLLSPVGFATSKSAPEPIKV